MAFTSQALHDGLKKSVNNALALSQEAQLLFTHGYYARAFVLWQTAVEELAKAALYFRWYLISVATGTVIIDKADRFWLRDHKSKYTVALHVATLSATRLFGPGRTLVLQEDEKMLVGARMRGLYVDYDEAAGQFVTPTDVITKAMAEERHQMFMAIFSTARYDVLSERLAELQKRAPSNLLKMLAKIEADLDALGTHVATVEGLTAGRVVYLAQLLRQQQSKTGKPGILLGYSLAFENGDTGFKVHKGGGFTVDHI